MFQSILLKNRFFIIVAMCCSFPLLQAQVSYCLPEYNGNPGQNKVDFCNAFRLGAIQSLDSDAATNAEYWQDFTHLSTDLHEGDTYTLEVQAGERQDPTFGDTIAVWIDYNQDGDFEDSEEKLGEVDKLDAFETATISFTVPAGVTSGPTRLRVCTAYFFTDLSPCGRVFTTGETEDYSVNIVTGVWIPTSSELQKATAGLSYNYNLSAEHGVQPYQWTLAANSLGLAIDAQTGQLNGVIPAQSGGASYTLDVSVSDAGGGSFDKSFSLYVTQQAQPLPFFDDFEAGSLDEYILSHGLDARSSIGDEATSGTRGLQLDAQPGDTNWSVTKAVADDPDQWPGDQKYQTLLLREVIVTGLSSIDVSFDYKIHNASVNSWYTNLVFEWSDDGGNSWQIASGSGAESTGIYRSETAGSFQNTDFQIQGFDATGQAPFYFRLRWLVKWSRDDTIPTWITVDDLELKASPAQPALQIATATLPDAEENQPYENGAGASVQLEASGGVKPYQWSLDQGTMPAGLNLNASNGKLTGIPAKGSANTYSLTFKVSDALGKSELVTLSLLVQQSASPVTPLDITTVQLPKAQVGQGYQTFLNASGGTAPYAWSMSGAPSWLTLDSQSGELTNSTAIPSSDAGQVFTLQISISDAGTPTSMSDTQSLTLEIEPQVIPLSISTSSLSVATEEVGYSAVLQAQGGKAPYSWSLVAGSFPQGVSFGSSGLIAGAPLKLSAGDYTLTLRVSDSLGQTADQNFTLQVVAAASGSGTQPQLPGSSTSSGGGGCSLFPASDKGALILFSFLLGVLAVSRLVGLLPSKR